MVFRYPWQNSRDFLIDILPLLYLLPFSGPKSVLPYQVFLGTLLQETLSGRHKLK